MVPGAHRVDSELLRRCFCHPERVEDLLASSPLEDFKRRGVRKLFKRKRYRSYRNALGSLREFPGLFEDSILSGVLVRLLNLPYLDVSFSQTTRPVWAD